MEGLLSVMPRVGYAGATIPAIAAAAGLAPGLVHYHFESKLEILVALVEELSRRLGQRFERRASRAGGAWERLDAFLDAHVALGGDADPDAVACWVVIGAEALGYDAVREVYSRAVSERLGRATGLIGDVLESEGRARHEAKRIAAALLAAIEGAYQLALVAGAMPRGSAAPMIRRMARGLVAADLARSCSRLRAEARP